MAKNNKKEFDIENIVVIKRKEKTIQVKKRTVDIVEYTTYSNANQTFYKIKDYDDILKNCIVVKDKFIILDKTQSRFVKMKSEFWQTKDGQEIEQQVLKITKATEPENPEDVFEEWISLIEQEVEL